MERRILFVCTGNTCRSPMAEETARHLISSEAIAGAEEWEVRSAGTSAGDGQKVAAEAVEALLRLGMRMGEKQTRRLTKADLEWATTIFAMTGAHVDAIRAMDARAEGRTVPLSPFGDVADPLGGSQEVYDRTAREMRWLIEWRLKELAGSP